MDMKLLAKLFGAFAAAVIAHEIINMRRKHPMGGPAVDESAPNDKDPLMILIWWIRVAYWQATDRILAERLIEKLRRRKRRRP